MSTAPSHQCACGYLLCGVDAGRCPECGRNIPTSSLAPIAQYCERRLWLAREFTLYADKVVLKSAVRFGNASITSFALSRMDPSPSNFWLRGKSLVSGIIFFISGGSVIMALLMEGKGKPPALNIWFAVAFSGYGLISILSSLRQTEFVRFHAAGRPEAILMDVGRAGPDAARFDEFVAVLRKTIIDAHGLQPPVYQPS